MAGFLHRSTAPQSSPDEPAVRAAVVSGALSALPSYCTVVAAHLHDVIDQTGEAAHSILGQLARVDSLADVMTGDVTSLAGAVGRAETELSQATVHKDQLMDRLIRYFLDRDEKIRDLVGEMRGLSQHVHQIEKVSQATNILALNAMIEAARAGDAGEGFAVVADEVRKLADRSAKAANDIGSTIAELTTKLDAVLADDSPFEDSGIPTGTGGGGTAVSGMLDGVTHAQRAMSDMVAEVLQDTVHAAQQVERSSNALSAETTRAVGHVQFQDISRQMIEHIVSAVADVQRQAEDVISYADGTVAEDVVLDRRLHIDDLSSKHVMGRQRYTHAESTGGDARSGNEPDIELF
jgi:methyl-accepting chemotaxis protein